MTDNMKQLQAQLADLTVGDRAIAHQLLTEATDREATPEQRHRAMVRITLMVAMLSLERWLVANERQTRAQAFSI